MVQPQTEPGLALTGVDGLEVPAELCAPSLRSLLGLWAGKVGCCCSEPCPGFRKEKKESILD